MKILVIDDTKKHLAAALQTLVGHEVTTCSSHDEANELLEEQYDKAKKQQYIDEGMSSWDAYRKASTENKLPYWDVVLCDLLMPAGSDAQGREGERLVGKEMAVGWSLALVAASRSAKFVAVVSDMNHHNHPASAMLDRLNGHLFTIDGARVLLTNRVSSVGIAGTECDCKECNGSGKLSNRDGGKYDCPYCKGSGKDFAEKGKDWGRILEILLKEKSEKE